MNRTRDYYRHHRRRIIATRLRRYGHLYYHPPTERQRGMLAKWNWTCDCGMCKLARSQWAYDRRAEKRSAAEVIRDAA